jgi:hypothetical protein
MSADTGSNSACYAYDSAGHEPGLGRERDIWRDHDPNVSHAEA